MKKILFCLLLCGCSASYTPVINQSDLSAVNFQDLMHQKTNESCTTLLLMFIPIDRKQSIAEAAWEAEIIKVSYVEQTNHWFFPLYSQSCVQIYGE